MSLFGFSFKRLLPHLLVQWFAFFAVTRLMGVFFLYKVLDPTGKVMLAAYILFLYPVLSVLTAWSDARNASALTSVILIAVLGGLSAFLLQVISLLLHYRVIGYPMNSAYILEAFRNSLVYCSPILALGELVRQFTPWLKPGKRASA